MGAIAAFLSRSGEPGAEIVDGMIAAAPHRGRRTETVVEGRCALSCANSEDLPDAGVASRDGVAAAFVGTLDNAPELARDLERRAARIEVGTPADLVAAGFRVYGQDLPRRLRGVFAAIVTDGNRVCCFRDHAGHAPLFYRSDARGFYTASEAKQVLSGAGIRKAPDLDVVEAIYFRNIVDETACALRGVGRLPKATLADADGDGVRLRRYWHPESLLETARFSYEELQERFDELMDQAVSRCLTGRDVVSLSGGIDSPAVAAFAAPRHLELTGRPLAAITAVYPRFPSVDEQPYVELLAAHLGLRLHTYEERANALDGLADWVALADTPYLSGSLASYAEKFRRARDLGFRVVLSGELAEAVFDMRGFLLAHLLAHGRFGAARRQLAARHARGTSWRALGFALAHSVAPAGLRAARRRRRRIHVPEWVDIRRANEWVGEFYTSARERWRKQQLGVFIGAQPESEVESVCLVACGVHARKPWTDVDVWELFLSLPAELKFPDTRSKGLVRRLLRGRVPDEILDRRDKTYFNEAMMARIDYATLRRFLLAPDHRVNGVDYDRLGDRLRRENLSLLDYEWAKNLAAVHAFLSQW